MDLAGELCFLPSFVIHVTQYMNKEYSFAGLDRFRTNVLRLNNVTALYLLSYQTINLGREQDFHLYITY